MIKDIKMLRNLVLFVLISLNAGCSSDKNEKAGKADHAEDKHTEGENADEHGEEHEPGNEGRVTLTEAAYRTAQIAVEIVAPGSMATVASTLEVPGQIESDPRRVTLISPRTSGRIERLAVAEGDRVGSGQAVALLYSQAYLTAQNDYLHASRRARALTGTQDAEGANAILKAAYNRLELLGASQRDIATLLAQGTPSKFLVLRAPFAGSITQAYVMPGAAVEAGTPVFTLTDLAVVDVVAEVPERALPLVHIGQRATISIAAYPGMQFDGRVERLKDVLNPETRTVRAVIHAVNKAGRLRPGMFASVHLSGLSASNVESNTIKSTTLTIPESAVVTDGTERIVFVEIEPRTYERRVVTTESLSPPGSSAATSSRIAIRSGIKAGERVVIRGAFTLKSELAKAELGEHGH